MLSQKEKILKKYYSNATVISYDGIMPQITNKEEL